MPAKTIPEPPSHPAVDIIHQSPPVDLTIPYDVKWVNGKTILITGGATGFGAAFIRLWAKNGATVIMGDVNVDGAMQLVRDVNKETGKESVHFFHTNVLDWQSLVTLFKKAVEVSPHGGIDTVVANAGIANLDALLTPANLDAAEPPKPDLRISDINYTGVLYTVHLALFWLPRNPGSNRHVDTNITPGASPRDRHILLLGSVASIGPLPPQPQYTASKHAVMGLFRALRATTFIQGIRINMVCPYFIDTPIVTTTARFLLAGGATGEVQHVVDAATRLVADQRIAGRALVIGPNVKMQQNPETGNMELLPKNADVKPQPIWEAYADDWEDTELMSRRFLGLLSQIELVRGWGGWAYDIVAAVVYGARKVVFGRGK